MLKVILNRLKPQGKEIVAKGKAGFRAGMGSTEQIFNLRVLSEMYLQHQQNQYRVLIGFKIAIDRVWLAADVQYQCKSRSHRFAALRQSYKCRPH